MMPYFIWNNIDSTEMPLFVSELPGITRPEERSQKVAIPGRAGDVTLLEGENIYNTYDRTCVITVPRETDLSCLLTWLRGNGEVVFSNEPDRAYFASITSVEFQKYGNALLRGNVVFHCQPYKAQVPAESIMTLTGSGTIYNPGDITAKPYMVLTCTGAASVMIGDRIMAFPTVASGNVLRIDCDAEIIEGPESWNGNWTGRYIHTPKGYSNFTVSGCSLQLTPRWRWL